MNRFLSQELDRMHASGPKSLPAIGFLTVLDDAQQGLYGGYLVLNANGRPLEFHCTTPVRPNRAQEILYGPTLKPFLYGEQIGKTLLTKAKQNPSFVCTDVEPALAVRDLVETPIALIGGQQADESPVRQRDLRVDAAHVAVSLPKSKALLSFSLGQQPVAVLSARASDRDSIIDCWEARACELDLGEPFGRIREAIEEAQRNAAQR